MHRQGVEDVDGVAHVQALPRVNGSPVPVRRPSSSTPRLYDLRMRHHLKNRYDRLRARGFWTLEEMAKHLGVVPSTVQRWYAAGQLKAYACGSHRRSQRLYEPPGLNPPRPQQGKKLLHTPTQP
jgi:excisionase family DNA binding protein